MTVVVEPVVAAETAAEAVRTLNHFTLTPPSAGTPGWENVGDLYRVVVELSVLVDRLPQVLRQVGRHLEGSVDSCEVDLEAAESSVATVARAAVELDCAVDRLSRVGVHLGAVQSAVAHLCEPSPALARSLARSTIE